MAERDINKDKVAFRYYTIRSEAWYDDKSTYDFANYADAFKFAINSDGYYPPYKLYLRTLYIDENGILYEDSEFLECLPNKKETKVTFYVLIGIRDIRTDYIRYIYSPEKTGSIDESLFDEYDEIGVLEVTNELINGKLKPSCKKVRKIEREDPVVQKRNELQH